MFNKRITKNFVRERIESPKHFSKFRIKEEGKHKIVIGKPKGEKKWRLQAILHPKNE